MSESPLPPPPPPGAAGLPTAGSAAEPPAAAGPPVRWKPLVAVAGSAVGGALVAFLISWAVIGNHSSEGRQPISSNGSAAQGQMPSSGQAPGYGTGRQGEGQGGQGQSSSGAQSGSGTTGRAPSGAMPSARSGAS